MKRCLAMLSMVLTLNVCLAAQWNSISLAAIYGDVKKVDYLLKYHNLPVDFQNKYGETLLMIAAQRGRHNVIEYLLDRGADINRKNNAGNTPLMYAVRETRTDRINTCIFLVNKGADIGITDNKDKSALDYAYEYERFTIVNFLLSKGAKDNMDRQNRNGWTKLMIAAEKGNLNEISDLIARGASVNFQNIRGYTPLMIAASNGQFEACKLLLEKGAGILRFKDQNGNTALNYGAKYKNISALFNRYTNMHLAALNNDVEMLKKAVSENGFDVNKKFKGEDLTPLYVAVLKNSTDAVKYLLTIHGIDADCPANGMTPLMVAANNGNLKICTALINANAKINMQGKGGLTALMLAALKNHLQICKLLIEKGADPEIKDDKGHTALQFTDNAEIKALFQVSDIWFTAEYGTAQALQKAFEKSGHNVDAVKNDWTALMFAVQGDNADTVNYLINKGANVNFKTSNGITPLMIAAGNKAERSCKLLIGKGVEIDEPDKDGCTALYYAALRKHLSLVNILLAADADPNFENNRAQTALHAAVAADSKEIIDTLIKAGTDISRHNSSVIAIAFVSGSPDTITHLMEKYKLKHNDTAKCINTVYERMKKEDSNIWTAFLIRNKFPVDWEKILLVAIDKNDIENIKKILPKIKFNSYADKKKVNFLSYYLYKTAKPDIQTIKLFTDAGCHIFYPSERKGPDIPLFGIHAEVVNSSPIGLAIEKNDFALANILLEAKKYCFADEVDWFKVYLENTASGCKDIKKKNKILRLARKLKNIAPEKTDKKQPLLVADDLYAKANAADPDLKTIGQEIAEAMDPTAAFAAAMSKAKGNHTTEKYIQSLILYDLAAALGHKKAAERGNEIRNNHKLFYSDILYARNAAVDKLKEAKMEDKISVLSETVPLPETNTQKIEIMKKCFISNYSSSKSIYKAVKYALPLDFKFFVWSSKGINIYEASGRVHPGKKYPYQGQMCPVDTSKPVVITFIEKEKGIPNMVAFKLFVDVPFLGSVPVYYSSMNGQQNTNIEDQFFKFIYY